MPVGLVLQLVVAILAVAAAVVGVVAAAVDRRWRILRVASIAVAYVAVEWCALVALFGVWLVRPVRGRHWAESADLRVLCWAIDRIRAAAGMALGFRVEVSEPPDLRPASESPPILVLARHAGIGDSIALVWLLTHRYRRRPRIVLKDAIAWDPLADVALSRLGASFLPSGSRRRTTGSDLVGATAASLEPNDAMLLFPEGRNWTPGRWRRAVRKLRMERKAAQARKAELMDHVLPPRWGGVAACLDARPDLPVVVFAHTGLDDISSARQLWSALPFRSPLSIRWWPSSPPPADEREGIDWLMREWAVVDEWIDSRQDR